MKTTYRVNGMTCGGCAGAVTRKIETLKAGEPIRVDVDLGAGTVSVEGTADEAAIGAAVSEAGFEFAGKVSG